MIQQRLSLYRQKVRSVLRLASSMSAALLTVVAGSCNSLPSSAQWQDPEWQYSATPMCYRDTTGDYCNLTAKRMQAERENAANKSISSPEAQEPSEQVQVAPRDGSAEVPLDRRNGILTVPVEINDQIKLAFVVDSGAADVALPADVVLTLIRTGTVRPSDFVGSQTYQMADGRTVPSPVLIIRKLRVGPVVISNVRCSVANAEAPLLLGQTFFRRLRSWSIDNSRQVLVLK